MFGADSGFSLRYLSAIICNAMIQCSNCGQLNQEGCNFCRFCGTAMVSKNPPHGYYEQPQRQPYSWKTDEFQASEVSGRPTQQINQVEPLPMAPPFGQPQQMAYQPPQPLAPGYRCPRCGGNQFPVMSRKISTAGWITFGVLLAVFFPLFWIGLLMKEDAKICPLCNFRVG